MDILDENTNKLALEQQGILEITESSKWARIMGIIVMVIAGLFGLFAVIGSFAMVTLLGAAAFAGFFYLAFAAFYFYMGLLLYRYSGNIDRAVGSGTPSNLTMGFKNLKTYFKINAIIIILGIVFTIVIYIVVGTSMLMGGGFPPVE
ncbi:MAG: hypothetical protein KDC57_09795 [Saprospiraceae bacterium]|nr:hypothetical protein [Saprospiraceae bacterium]